MRTAPPSTPARPGPPVSISLQTGMPLIRRSRSKGAVVDEIGMRVLDAGHRR
ncbi:hypothetical protein [Actinopolyspora halophila]|uniref:hypothetical protein n=1 Tax=Actinopolyspora halophila TaxID=1850 RepID=UPI0003A589E9|nr:hypothetical protein [Actinopolyspora halophila]